MKNIDADTFKNYDSKTLTVLCFYFHFIGFFLPTGILNTVNIKYQL